MIYYFKDNFGNTAKIETVEILPYKGAKKKIKSFRLCLFADYDRNFLYFVSVYDNQQEAIEKLKSFSCGTFKRA